MVPPINTNTTWHFVVPDLAFLGSSRIFGSVPNLAKNVRIISNKYKFWDLYALHYNYNDIMTIQLHGVQITYCIYWHLRMPGLYVYSMTYWYTLDWSLLFQRFSYSFVIIIIVKNDVDILDLGILIEILAFCNPHLAFCGSTTIFKNLMVNISVYCARKHRKLLHQFFTKKVMKTLIHARFRNLL